MDDRTLKAWRAAMEDTVRVYREVCRRTPRRFVAMMAEHGALPAAKLLLRRRPANELHSGFVKFWEKGRLDATAEAKALLPEFAGLFTDEELAEARRRLRAFRYEAA